MLPCMNCQQSVPTEDLKIFAECPLCPTCYNVALRIHQQGELELKQILTLLKELIRTAIVQRRLALPPPPKKVDGQVVQPRAIDEIVKMIRRSPDAIPRNG